MSQQRKVLTLILIVQNDHVLLGMKKRGFGAGKWNGFGGKVEPGETILEACQRELHEECGITAVDPEHLAVLLFEFEGEPVVMEVHVYRATQFVGEPVETEEMLPKWYPLDAVPFAQMWADDPLWFPRMLRGEKFFGQFLFRGHDTIVKHHLTSEIPPEYQGQ